MMKIQTKRRAVVFTDGVAMRVWADGGQGLLGGKGAPISANQPRP